MALKFEPPAKKKKILSGFGSFKAELADILTEDIISQLAIYFNYPPVKYDLLKKDVGRNYLMVHCMEERGHITETDITTLLRALEARKLHGIKKRVQTMFELHTGKRSTGDDQSMQQPEDQTGNLDLGSKGSSTSDGYDKSYLSGDDTDKKDVPASSLSGSHVPSQSAYVPHTKKRRLDDSTAAVMGTRSSRNSAVSPFRSTDQVLSKSLIINKKGGRLDIPGTGASLEIPSGALEEEQLIQMIIIPHHLESESLTFASNSSLVVELLPSHVNLLKPAILTLPHCLVLKKGCEWKAQIYRSHHKEGREPQWEEQFSTYYELGEHSCKIQIQRFSWEKFLVLDKIVEAKNIIVYAAGRCGPTDSMYLDIGYYWDLATCEKVPILNNANLLHERRTIFYNDGKDLNISLKEFRPRNWTCSTGETNTQVISFDQVAINRGTFRTFDLYTTNETDACTCHFKAGQAPNLEDYTFLLKAPDPSSVTQSSTSDRQETARAGRSTAGIPASDRVVTTATIQGLSERLCRGWMTVGRKLEIGEPQLEAIDACDIIAQEKVHRMLSTWKQSKGKEATCGLLGEALQASGRKDLKEYVYKQGCSTESEKA